MRLSLLPLCAFALAACSKTQEPTPSPSLTTTTTTTVATAIAAGSAPRASVLHPGLVDPSKANDKAPDVYKAKFQTSQGDFVIEVHRDWAPNGADRFYNLVKLGFYDDTRMFRAIEGFMVQFGISGDPSVSAKWQLSNIADDPVKQSNKRGFVTFAQTSAPNSRSTQVFVNYGDNSRLDGQRFAPFGQVTQGMENVDKLFKGYGESPNQGLIQSSGNAYLDANFPNLSRIVHAEIVK